MDETITKTEENQVVVEKTIVTADRIEREMFSQELLDIQKTNAEKELALIQTRIDLLDKVQLEMNKELEAK